MQPDVEAEVALLHLDLARREFNREFEAGIDLQQMDALRAKGLLLSAEFVEVHNATRLAIRRIQDDKIIKAVSIGADDDLFVKAAVLVQWGCDYQPRGRFLRRLFRLRQPASPPSR